MTQPTALYLADVLANDPCSKAHHDAAAAELRRQHEEIKVLHERHHDDNVEYTRSLAQRDELLEALKKIASIEDQMYGNDWEEIEEARVIARAAIAKAEEKK